VAQNNVVGALPNQIEVDIKAHAVGAHVIQSGIHHPGGERVDLHFTCAEVGSPCARQRHMEWALLTEIVVERRLVMISDGYSPHPGKDRPSVDLRNALQIHPSRSQPALIHDGKQILITLRILGSYHRNLKRTIAAPFQ
jgi:hypothetical protein